MLLLFSWYGMELNEIGIFLFSWKLNAPVCVFCYLLFLESLRDCKTYTCPSGTSIGLLCVLSLVRYPPFFSTITLSTTFNIFYRTHMIYMQISTIYRSKLLSKSSKRTIVLALELLDNLPHDKLSSCPHNPNRTLQAEIRLIPPSSSFSSTTAQSHITNNNRIEELFVPLTDPLLQHIIRLQPSYLPPSSVPRWIPTAACGLLRHILENRRNYSALFCDFD